MIYIYEHFYITPDGDEKIFYVGRTQHKRHAKLITHKTSNWYYFYKFYCNPDNFARVINEFTEDEYKAAITFQRNWIKILTKNKHPITNTTIRKSNKKKRAS